MKAIPLVPFYRSALVEEDVPEPQLGPRQIMVQVFAVDGKEFRREALTDSPYHIFTPRLFGLWESRWHP